MLLGLQQQREVKMGPSEGTKKDSELEDQGRRLDDHLEEHRRAVWSGMDRGMCGPRPGTQSHPPGLGTCPLERHVPGVWGVCSQEVGSTCGNGLA